MHSETRCLHRYFSSTQDDVSEERPILKDCRSMRPVRSLQKVSVEPRGSVYTGHTRAASSCRPHPRSCVRWVRAKRARGERHLCRQGRHCALPAETCEKDMTKRSNTLSGLRFNAWNALGTAESGIFPTNHMSLCDKSQLRLVKT